MGGKGKVSSSRECAYNRVLRFADDAQRKQSKEDDLDEAERAAPRAGREEDPDDEGDEIHAGVISEENALRPGDYEVEDENGNVTIIRGDRLLSQEEIESEDDRVITAAKADKRFDKITAHRRLRFKDILDRGVSLYKLSFYGPLPLTALLESSERTPTSK
jgi:hypothetical protein